MLKAIVEQINEDERELSPLQKEYQSYFQNLLKEYKVTSPADMDTDTMKKFFNQVRDGWEKGKGAKKQ